MTKVPKNIELSSLPMMNSGSPRVEFSLSGFDEEQLENIFTSFLRFLYDNHINFVLS